jgi:ElaB/YqjD/DUF883 family membrane-anchored ribosome-binding protein
MAEKKSVDEAIEETAAKASGGLTGFKDSLGKAQQAMDNARSAMQDAYGKAKDKTSVGAERAKVYLEDAKKYLGEAREKMGSLAASTRDQAETLYGSAKEQYEHLSESARDLYGKAKAKVAEVDFKQKGDEVLEYIRANPGKSVLIALAVGFVVGYATRPRD